MSSGGATQRVGVGVAGVGFVGQKHVRAYRDAGASLVAVFDRNEARRRGEPTAHGNLGETGGEALFDATAVRGTDDFAAFLETPGLSLVSICTPTDTHAALAIEALRAGKHVVVEKPVALRSADVLAIAEAAASSGKLCMPAMCMRFWPAWAWVREAIVDRRLGEVVSVRLERLGATPNWSPDYYLDESRSGGALLDLHVHDTDFVTWALGQPSAVFSVGDSTHVATAYLYDDRGVRVTAEGGWMGDAAFPFRMRMTARFERGVADFDAAREPQLVVYRAGGGEEAPEVDARTGWEVEIEAMVRAVERLAAGGESGPPATMSSAAASMAVLEAERASLATGRPERVGGAGERGVGERGVGEADV